VKMNLGWLAVALLLTTISLPATLMATDGPDGDPNGPPPVFRHPSVPPDGDPNGPPPGVVAQLAGQL
jgi:hypothetical protein